MEHEPSSSRLDNERRDFFRIIDTVMMRVRPVNQSAALANIIPAQFRDDPAFALMQQLQQIDHDNSQFLWSIAEKNRDVEAYLKGINRKIELISAHLIASADNDPDQSKQTISLSEGGLGFHSDIEYGHDSYLAIQVTLLPSRATVVLFAKVINCTKKADDFAVAVGFVQLNKTTRKLIAKHIMQLQLAERRKHHEEDL